MSGLVGPRQTSIQVPSLEEQLGAVTKALTAEVLRHAETRLKLEAVLAVLEGTDEHKAEREGTDG